MPSHEDELHSPTDNEEDLEEAIRRYRSHRREATGASGTTAVGTFRLHTYERDRTVVDRDALRRETQRSTRIRIEEIARQMGEDIAAQGGIPRVDPTIPLREEIAARRATLAGFYQHRNQLQDALVRNYERIEELQAFINNTTPSYQPNPTFEVNALPSWEQQRENRLRAALQPFPVDLARAEEELRVRQQILNELEATLRRRDRGDITVGETQGPIEQEQRMLDQALYELAGFDELAEDDPIITSHINDLQAHQVWQADALATLLQDRNAHIRNFLRNAGDPDEQLVRFEENNDLAGLAGQVGAIIEDYEASLEQLNDLTQIQERFQRNQARLVTRINQQREIFAEQDIPIDPPSTQLRQTELARLIRNTNELTLQHQNFLLDFATDAQRHLHAIARGLVQDSPQIVHRVFEGQYRQLFARWATEGETLRRLDQHWNEANDLLHRPTLHQTPEEMDQLTDVLHDLNLHHVAEGITQRRTEWANINENTDATASERIDLNEWLNSTQELVNIELTNRRDAILTRRINWGHLVENAATETLELFADHINAREDDESISESIADLRQDVGTLYEDMETDLIAIQDARQRDRDWLSPPEARRQSTARENSTDAESQIDNRAQFENAFDIVLEEFNRPWLRQNENQLTANLDRLQNALMLLGLSPILETVRDIRQRWRIELTNGQGNESEESTDLNQWRERYLDGLQGHRNEIINSAYQTHYPSTPSIRDTYSPVSYPPSDEEIEATITSAQAGQQRSAIVIPPPSFYPRRPHSSSDDQSSERIDSVIDSDFGNTNTSSYRRRPLGSRTDDRADSPQLRSTVQRSVSSSLEYTDDASLSLQPRVDAEVPQQDLTFNGSSSPASQISYVPVMTPTSAIDPFADQRLSYPQFSSAEKLSLPEKHGNDEKPVTDNDSDISAAAGRKITKRRVKTPYPDIRQPSESGGSENEEEMLTQPPYLKYIKYAPEDRTGSFLSTFSGNWSRKIKTHLHQAWREAKEGLNYRREVNTQHVDSITKIKRTADIKKPRANLSAIYQGTSTGHTWLLPVDKDWYRTAYGKDRINPVTVKLFSGGEYFSQEAFRVNLDNLQYKVGEKIYSVAEMQALPNDHPHKFVPSTAVNYLTNYQGRPTIEKGVPPLAVTATSGLPILSTHETVPSVPKTRRSTRQTTKEALAELPSTSTGIYNARDIESLPIVIHPINENASIESDDIKDRPSPKIEVSEEIDEFLANAFKDPALETVALRRQQARGQTFTKSWNELQQETIERRVAYDSDKTVRVPVIINTLEILENFLNKALTTNIQDLQGTKLASMEETLQFMRDDNHDEIIKVLNNGQGVIRSLVTFIETLHNLPIRLRCKADELPSAYQKLMEIGGRIFNHPVGNTIFKNWGSAGELAKSRAAENCSKLLETAIGNSLMQLYVDGKFPKSPENESSETYIAAKEKILAELATEIIAESQLTPKPDHATVTKALIDAENDIATLFITLPKYEEFKRLTVDKSKNDVSRILKFFAEGTPVVDMPAAATQFSLITKDLLPQLGQIIELLKQQFQAYSSGKNQEQHQLNGQIGQLLEKVEDTLTSMGIKSIERINVSSIANSSNPYVEKRQNLQKEVAHTTATSKQKNNIIQAIGKEMSKMSEQEIDSTYEIIHLKPDALITGELMRECGEGGAIYTLESHFKDEPRLYKTSQPLRPENIVVIDGISKQFTNFLKSVVKLKYFEAVPANLRTRATQNTVLVPEKKSKKYHP